MTWPCKNKDYLSIYLSITTQKTTRGQAASQFDSCTEMASLQNTLHLNYQAKMPFKQLEYNKTSRKYVEIFLRKFKIWKVKTRDFFFCCLSEPECLNWQTLALLRREETIFMSIFWRVNLSIIYHALRSALRVVILNDQPKRYLKARQVVRKSAAMFTMVFCEYV